MHNTIYDDWEQETEELMRENAIASAMNEAKHYNRICKRLSDECFSVRNVTKHSDWWEVNVQMKWHAFNDESVQDESLPEQCWLHRISIDGLNGEPIGHIIDVEE